MRVVTPLLKVTDGPGLSPATALDTMSRGKVAFVTTDDLAREVLRHLGMPECCVEDRISVSHGGPILCDEHCHHGVSPRPERRVQHAPVG